MSDMAKIRRPVGFPLAGLPAFMCQYILAGLGPTCILMMSGYFLGSNQDNLLKYFWIYVLGVGGALLGVIFSVRSGRLWGVYVFRWFSWALIVLLAVDLTCALLLATGHLGDASAHTRSAGQYFTLLTGLCVIPAVIMVRNIRRVRWLDPHSRPEEWEPPMPRAARRR